jgi:hypothetical protein
MTNPDWENARHLFFVFASSLGLAVEMWCFFERWENRVFDEHKCNRCIIAQLILYKCIKQSLCCKNKEDKEDRPSVNNEYKAGLEVIKEQRYHRFVL